MEQEAENSQRNAAEMGRGVNCPECGARLPEGSPPGNCPACLMAVGLVEPAGIGGDPPPERTGDQNLRFLEAPVEAGTIGVFDSFDVIEVIGGGGMGIVLKARDPELNRTVAIKVLAPNLATSGEARQRFRREANSAAAVRHDNIIVIHSVGEWNQLPYLVMEFVDGETLEQRLERSGPLQVESIVRLGSQIASALGAAHSAGLVHRDIKPANILITGGERDPGSERIKITDFGLARAVDDPGLTLAGSLLGTPGFMSPEQVEGGGELGPRSDLFSFGCVLYAMATGNAPFRGRTTVEALRRVVDAQPAAPSGDQPVPKWLSELILRLLRKDPSQRPAAAEEVSKALKAEKLPAKPTHTPRRWLLAAPAIAASVIAAWLLWPERDSALPATPPLPLAAKPGSWGWPDLAAAEIVSEAESSGQEFFVAPVNTEDEWRRLLELLPLADSSSIRIFAMLGGPTLPTSKPVRWFAEMDRLGTRSDPDSPPPPRPRPGTAEGSGAERWADQRRCMGEWLDAWVRAAEVLSMRSREHPSLAGIVITLFEDQVESAGHPHGMEGDRLSIEEVKRIHTAAHAHNPGFGFYPKINYARFGANLVPGYVLGVNYGVHLFPDDRAEVELRFDLPSSAAEEPVVLSFCQNDSIRRMQFPEVEKQILVNATELWAESVALDGFKAGLRNPGSTGPGLTRVELVETPIPDGTRCPGGTDLAVPPGLLRPGAGNAIVFRLKNTATGETNGCGALLWEIWNLSITIGGRAIAPNPTFRTAPHPDPYAISNDCSPHHPGQGPIANWQPRTASESAAALLPDSEHEGRCRQRLIATPNDHFLITGFIDGAIVREERAAR